MLDFQREAIGLSLPAFSLAFILTLVLTWIFANLPSFRLLNDRHEAGRSGERRQIHRLGGVAIILAFWFTLFVEGSVSASPQLLALLLGSVIILLFGLLDDILPLSWPFQLSVQVILAVLLILFGLRIELMQGLFGGTWDFRDFFIPGFSSILVLLWLLLIMNAINWVDGLDGLGLRWRCLQRHTECLRDVIGT